MVYQSENGSINNLLKVKSIRYDIQFSLKEDGVEINGKLDWRVGGVRGGGRLCIEYLEEEEEVRLGWIGCREWWLLLKKEVVKIQVEKYQRKREWL